MTEAATEQLPATEATVTEPAAPPAQTVFATLKDAVSTPGVIDEKTKVYRVTQRQGAVNRSKIVIACSPSAAALEVIGRENVELVDLREKLSAAFEALTEAKAVKE
jgi:hypothetical protein